MANTTTESIIDTIIEKSGDCLDHHLCRDCPFAQSCLPTFVVNSPNGTSKGERLAMALDYIAKQILIEEPDA